MTLFFKKNPYQSLEKCLGYRFRHKHLLATALMHRSFRFESTGIEADNQRLEFLGDAALGLVASAYLFEACTDLQEGPLTSLRSQLASGKALAQVGRSIQLGPFITLGKGEQLSGGRDRDSNLMDAMEAILGAAYLDGHLQAVQKIFKKLFVPLVDLRAEDRWLDNAKGQLQALAQQRWKANPVYRIARQEGPSHASVFTVEVRIKDKALGSGRGHCKREAEQQAAREALKHLRQTQSNA